MCSSTLLTKQITQSKQVRRQSVMLVHTTLCCTALPTPPSRVTRGGVSLVCQTQELLKHHHQKSSNLQHYVVKTLEVAGLISTLKACLVHVQGWDPSHTLLQPLVHMQYLQAIMATLPFPNSTSIGTWAHMLLLHTREPAGTKCADYSTPSSLQHYVPLRLMLYLM